MEEEFAETATFSPEINRKSTELAKGQTSVFNRLEEIAELSRKNTIDVKEKFEAEKAVEFSKEVTFKPEL